MSEVDITKVDDTFTGDTGVFEYRVTHTNGEPHGFAIVSFMRLRTIQGLEEHDAIRQIGLEDRDLLGRISMFYPNGQLSHTKGSEQLNAKIRARMRSGVGSKVLEMIISDMGETDTKWILVDSGHDPAYMPSFLTKHGFTSFEVHGDNLFYREL